jgi:hypothetical protein
MAGVDQTIADDDRCLSLQNYLHPSYLSLVVWLFDFLAKIMSYQESNKMTAKNLGTAH